MGTEPGPWPGPPKRIRTGSSGSGRQLSGASQQSSPAVENTPRPAPSPSSTAVPWPTAESEIPFYAKQQRVILHNCGHINPENIQDYIDVGGYQALRKALLEMTPEGGIKQFSAAGLLLETGEIALLVERQGRAARTRRVALTRRTTGRDDDCRHDDPDRKGRDDGAPHRVLLYARDVMTSAVAGRGSWGDAAFVA